MNAVALDSQFSKPLPSPAGSDKLPVPPPHENLDLDFRSSPNFHAGASSLPPTPPKLGALPSVAPLDAASFLPPTPTTPSTPISPTSAEPKAKKSNPLTDLIDTEKHYVDQLAGIIRRVASAWSRSNLPPPELDTMFRSVEGVYKANRGLLNKLKEIGTNPKALGDLLMRWIDDLETPYTNYCTKYSCGFDYWDPVTSNTRLQPILSEFSLKFPPPTSLISTPELVWTLDALFLLPKLRLKYYKKLYSRLLKSTVPGRSDYNLLLGALDKLDRLLETLEMQEQLKVGSSPQPPPDAPELGEDEVVVDLRTQRESAPVGALSPNGSDIAHSENSSVAGSSRMGERLSSDTATTSISRGSSQTMSMPISELERRLSTDRTMDIFSMKPKSVRLQMTPPGLTFKRELRLSMDVIISVTPRVTGVEVVHRRGHIFLLSDLFLVCERMTSEEREAGGSEGPDMWLCYPPLAGKVLRVSEVSPDTLQIAIMRKENIFLQTETNQARDFLLSEFKDCIEFAGSVVVSKQPPPPMPPLPGAVRPGEPQWHGEYDSRSGSISPPQRTSLPSPPGGQHQPLQFNGNGPPSAFRPMNGRYSDSSDNQSFDGHRSPPPLQRGPSIQAMHPNDPRSYQDGPPINPVSFSPGQVLPPSRSTSIASHHNGGPPPRQYSASPGEMMGGLPGGPGPGFQRSPGPPFQGPPHLQGPPGHIQQGLPNFPRQGGPTGIPSRPPSEPYQHGGMHKTPSTRSLHSQYEQPPHSAPPVPVPSLPPNGYPQHSFMPPRGQSYDSLPVPRPLLPSANNERIASGIDVGQPSFAEFSPPNSPTEDVRSLPTGPVTSTVSAQMKCKVFLKQQHAQWKSLGAAKLKLYVQDPTNIKQLVVEADNKEHAVLISTIVLTDGVERVGKTGVAIELSDKGARTGIVYMIQLRNEKSAGGLFDSLLAGSDRAN